MATNDFKPFAGAVSANVTDQADYEVLPALLSGFSSGVASSAQVNKALRQGTAIASVVAQFISDQTSSDVLDDGDTGGLKTKLLSALISLISANALKFSAIYPVGVVIFFAKNVNPNTIFPGTTWTYIGENKTIRLGAQAGTNVLSTGGADSINISQANLPAVALAVNGNVSATDLGTVSTSPDPGHVHTGVPGRSAPWEAGGNTQTDFNFSNLGNTDAGGAHAHTVTLGTHTHALSGAATQNMGSGTALSVVNAYVMLMGWYRTA